MRITWGELEVGHRITGGWRVAHLDSDRITVADEETGDLQTFTRKDPWAEVEIEVPRPGDIARQFGGYILQEETLEGITYFAWPDDRDFLTAAQSHMTRVHGTDTGEMPFEEVVRIHDELHQRGADHTHIEREDD